MARAHPCNGTRTAPFAADEAIEDVGLDVEGDAAAGVGHLQLDFAQRLLGRDGDRAAGRRLVHRVFHQMLEDLTQSAPVAADQTDVIRAVHHHGDTA